jgi:hypothetical protein
VDAEWVGIAGVAGTLIGTLGASWFGFRQALLNAAEQREEAARQRRFESLQERREPRQKAYSDFIAAGQEIVDVLNEAGEGFILQYESLQSALRKRRAVVAIAGPDFVVTAAGEFSDEVRQLRNELVHQRLPGHPSNHRHRIERRLDSFCKAARSALEDDGQPPRATA